MKRIEGADRHATPEEKAILVKYTGWGAMPGAFELQPSRDWRVTARELKETYNGWWTLDLPGLIAAKRAAGRPKDLQVLPEPESLLEASEEQGGS